MSGIFSEHIASQYQKGRGERGMSYPDHFLGLPLSVKGTPGVELLVDPRKAVYLALHLEKESQRNA